MTMKYFVRGSVTLLIVLTPIIVYSAPTKVGKYIIPGAFSRSLEQGMTVPVYIRYNETDEKVSRKLPMRSSRSRMAALP